MADNKQAPGAGEAAPTAAEYKKAQARVRELVEKRRGLDRKLVSPPAFIPPTQSQRRTIARKMEIIADADPELCAL
jgi:hypothetical protein